ncbi:uncharacterized protein LOC110683174 [Chenopodium quinoa]|uniref:uncharacterized protein LOC110683174 n=1 Tax=Chenopodium quinoa TaxID=63459 RepID=UPI000B77F502|nr:uncharacterized protein LOC110683174 [Chenopodium quinoa]
MAYPRPGNNDIVNDLMPISFFKERKILLANFLLCNVACVNLQTLEITDFELPGFGRIWNVYVCPENLLSFKDAEDGLARDTKNERQKAKINEKSKKVFTIICFYYAKI